MSTVKQNSTSFNENFRQYDVWTEGIDFIYFHPTFMSIFNQVLTWDLDTGTSPIWSYFEFVK